MSKTIDAPQAVESTLEEALLAQLKAVGAELLAAREREAALKDQLRAVGEELAASRATVATLQRDMAGMIPATFDAPFGARQIDDGFLAPERYAAVINRLKQVAAERPDDADVQLALADAYLLAPAGGPRLTKAAMWLMAKVYDVDAAVAALRAAHRLRPDDRGIAGRLHAARRLAAPPIVIVTLPKSGSEFMRKLLPGAFGKFTVAGTSSGPHSNAVGTHGLNVLMQVRAVTVPHFVASRTNLQELCLQFKLERMVVHVRDPRQVLISWYHYLPPVIANADNIVAAHWDVPADYNEWPAERQLDWCIDHQFAWSVDWIKGWLDAEALSWFTTRILFTRFEDMVKDQGAFFRRIVDFYGIDPDLFEPPPQVRPRPNQFNFRRGEIDEWRSVLTPAQIERVNARIPDSLFQRFDWPR